MCGKKMHVATGCTEHGARSTQHAAWSAEHAARSMHACILNHAVTYFCHFGVFFVMYKQSKSKGRGRNKRSITICKKEEAHHENVTKSYRWIM